MAESKYCARCGSVKDKRDNCRRCASQRAWDDALRRAGALDNERVKAGFPDTVHSITLQELWRRAKAASAAAGR